MSERRRREVPDPDEPFHEEYEESYKGYTISVMRGVPMGIHADLVIHWAIWRESDGWIADADYSYEEATAEAFGKGMRERIDNELAEADPWGEKERG